MFLYVDNHYKLTLPFFRIFTYSKDTLTADVFLLQEYEFIDFIMSKCDSPVSLDTYNGLTGY